MSVREKRISSTIKVRVEIEEDIYKIQNILIEKNSSSELRTVVEEFASNMIEYKERGYIIANCKRVDCFIEKSSLNLEKIGFLKLAICLSEDMEQNPYEPIKINKKKNDLGGYGIKMILNHGWSLKLYESKSYYIIVAKK